MNPNELALTKWERAQLGGGHVDAVKYAELTEGERECLRFVAAGLRSKEIGPRLGISNHTVDDRLKKALRKLGFSDRIEAARALLEWENGHQRLVHQPGGLSLGAPAEPEAAPPSKGPVSDDIEVREEQRLYTPLAPTDEHLRKLPARQVAHERSPQSPAKLFVLGVLALGVGFAGFTDAILRAGGWITRFLHWLERTL